MHRRRTRKYLRERGFERQGHRIRRYVISVSPLRKLVPQKECHESESREFPYQDSYLCRLHQTGIVLVWNVSLESIGIDYGDRSGAFTTP